MVATCSALAHAHNGLSCAVHPSLVDLPTCTASTHGQHRGSMRPTQGKAMAHATRKERQPERGKMTPRTSALTALYAQQRDPARVPCIPARESAYPAARVLSVS